jgi:hypothetical protein
MPALAAVIGAAIYACDSSTEPEAGSDTPQLAFEPASVDLGEGREATVSLVNRGTSAIGPIQLQPGPVSRGGGPVVGVQLQAVPSEISTLDPGAGRSVTLSLVFTSSPQPGSYEASLQARFQDATIGVLGIRFSVSPPPPPGTGRTVTITAGPIAPRQGDVVMYTAEVRDSTGAPVSDTSLTWSAAPGSAGLIMSDGRFVGYAPGAAGIVAAIAGAADTLDIDIVARALSGNFSVVGRGEESSRFTSDLWVHGNYAYTGTWSCRGNLCGNRLHVWDVSDPRAPSPTDTVVVDAQVVNDVKVRADGAIGVITHEGSSDARNGVTLLDLSNPAQPTVITRFTSGLESGVHNAWIEGNYVYVVVDGFGNGMRVIDISNPGSPSVVASYTAGTSILHDVYVRNGLAFLSHWDAGLVILDVGNGIAGGSPASPVEVSRIQTAGGQTHNAWYWPATGYVFVGEEDFDAPGVMHVVDASDLRNPKEVATFAVPGTAPHNFWLDEARAILYLAWYENGLRALDVSGALLGSLERQGREIASIRYGSGSGCFGGAATCTWAPQLHNGLVYVSDLNTGLWVLQPSF